MSRRRKKFEKFEPPYDCTPLGAKHVRLDELMMRSEAWQALSLPARCLLIELMRLHNAMNNGDLFLSTRDAASRLGINKDTVTRKFRELDEMGFIKPTQRGAFSLKKRHATTWRITLYGTLAETRPTKDFMRWKPAKTPTEKQNAVPLMGTECPNDTDRKRQSVPNKGTDCPTGSDRKPHKPTVLGPNDADTGSRYHTSPSKPAPGITCPPAPPASPTSDQPRSARTAGGPEQIDLEELTGRAANQPHPDEALRAATIAWCDREGKGAHKRLAGLIGLSTYHLSNFKSGRFALNPTAKAMLREVVLGQRAA